MDLEKIGKFIKEIRQKNNLTQKELADRYGVTYQAVSKWENAKNMPDISLIKQMSKDFNISLDDFLEGEYKEIEDSSVLRKKHKRMLIIISIICALMILLIIMLIFKSSNDDFEFKTLTSTCSDFSISGSIAYNKNKSAIYITNINYCGGDDTIDYNKIECILYETNNNVEQKIGIYTYDEENITLEEFLKQVTFTIDNYNSVCKDYTNANLYMLINATDEKGKITSYNISLSLDDSCE